MTEANQSAHMMNKTSIQSMFKMKSKNTFGFSGYNPLP